MPKKARDDLDVYSSDVASAGGSQNQLGQHSLRDTSMRMADNGGGAISAELNAQLNARAKAAAERASAAYAREHQQGDPPIGGYGGYGGYGGGAPAAPTYSYVPGTFNYQYGYKPTEFAGQYNYTPGEFTGQYGYNPTQFQYQSQYADLINAAREKLTNWNYDPNQDVSYKAYKNQYTRAGQQAMTDALARYASKTGGVASSYAASAAQQQYNNYMAQLAAKVPELEQLAYNRAADELQRYVAADQDAYNRAYNEYADWENRQRAAADTEYNNAWEQYVDWENRQRAAADTEYNNAWDQYTDWQNRLRTQADTDYDIAYRRWQTEEAAREQAAQNAYNAQVAAYNAKYGGSSGGSTGSGKTSGNSSGQDRDAQFKEISGYLKNQSDPIGYLVTKLNDKEIDDAMFKKLIDDNGMQQQYEAYKRKIQSDKVAADEAAKQEKLRQGKKKEDLKKQKDDPEDDWLLKGKANNPNFKLDFPNYYIRNKK